MSVVESARFGAEGAALETKARRCVVHAGLAKTGSTAIQAFLAANRAPLLERTGILYPGREPCHSQLQALFSRDPARLIQVRRLGLADGGAVAEHLAAYRAGFERDVASAAPREILISSEYFVSMEREELERLREFLLGFADEVAVLAYVRDPWSYAESYAQQCLRDGLWSGPVELGYMRSNVELLERLEAGFGCRAVVRPYLQADEAPFDVVRDFLGAIGANPEDDWRPAPPRPNEAVSFATACLLTAFNAYHPQFDETGSLVPSVRRDWILNALCAAGRGGGRIRLSAAAARRILEAARTDLEVLHRDYLGGDEVYLRHYRQRNFGGSSDVVDLGCLGKDELVALLLEALERLADRAHEFWEWSRRAEAARLCGVGLASLERGDAARARESFEAALRYRPDDPGTRRQLALLAPPRDDPGGGPDA